VWQPVVYLGPGRITFGEGVQLGWPESKGFHSGYCQLEVRRVESVIEIGARAEINNDAFIKSEGAGISIGADALIGSQVCVYDSDFHDLHPTRRRAGTPKTAPVVIGENAFLGDGVLVLKGVEIGRDSVIGAGSVVTTSIPAGVVAAGNPARVVRELDS
jgi:maltose O-acetyltransferase